MQDLSNFSIKGITAPMVFVPPDSFLFQEKKEMRFTKGFYIGKYPVTQALWEAVMGNNPAYFKGRKNHPVENISWDNISQENGFLDKFNALETVQKINQKDGLKFRLPAETMWEYAARGGNKSKGFPYSGSHKLNEVGWYDKNSYRETQPVGLKLPNELGIHDMSGNVWEWCADYYQANNEQKPTDGSPWIGDKENTRRVIRGGSWYTNDFDCRVSTRLRLDADLRINDIGFRFARY